MRTIHREALVALTLVMAASSCVDTDPVASLRDGPHQTNAGVDWRDQVIYQVMVDRFDNGDPNNDFNVELSAPARYHGGDWQGLRNRLDYLQELGITALWVSPVVRNVEQDAGFASYHGYWAQDLVRPNPHFGDLMTLRELVDDAHERGMLVILDVVTNHVGQLFYYDINGNGRPDDTLMGAGVGHTCVQVCGTGPEQPDICNPACSEGECRYCREGYSYFERLTEWDPEYDPRGIQGWTSLGFSGPAEIRFLDMPEINRTPPARPPAWFDWSPSTGWFDNGDWYNRRGRVYVWWHEWGYPRDFVREEEVYGDFPGGLKDLNTDHPVVQDALIRVFQHWITVADFDGFRIDTLKHIDRPEVDPNLRGFWGRFTDAMRSHAASLGKENFFMFGEAFDGSDELIGAYTFGGVDEEGPFGRLDSVFYFSQKFRVIDEVFKHGGPTRNIECLYSARMGIAPAEGDTWCADHGFPAGPTYEDEPHASPEEGGTGLPPNISLVSFLDNHDLARFLFSDADVATLHNALFFLLTWDGIPCIYYGTEQLFDGGNDPRNREDMFEGNPEQGFAPFDTSHETFRYVQELIRLRREHVALRRGDVTVRWATESPRGERDSGLFAFERRHDEERVLVVVNTAGEQESTTCAPDAAAGACMSVSFAPGTTLTDVGPFGDGYSVTVGGDSTVSVAVPARAGRILVAN